MFGDGEDVSLQWVRLLGRMPDLWWEGREAREMFFDEEGEPLDTGDGAQGAKTITLEPYLGDKLAIKDAASGVTRTLEVPQRERLSLAELLSMTLRYDPEERPSVGKILSHAYWNSKVGEC